MLDAHPVKIGRIGSFADFDLEKLDSAIFAIYVVPRIEFSCLRIDHHEVSNCTSGSLLLRGSAIALFTNT